MSNKEVRTIEFSDYFRNPGNTAWVKFEDSLPEDGWGPYLKELWNQGKLDVISEICAPDIFFMSLEPGLNMMHRRSTYEIILNGKGSHIV